MKGGRLLLYSLIAAMILFWSGNFIVGKVALREFPPVLLCGLRVGLAGILVLPVYWWDGRRAPHKWTRSDVPGLLMVGMVGVALNQLFFVMGLSRTTVAHSAIIIGLGPILVLLWAAAVKLETLTARRAAGMLIALAGVAVLKAFEQRGKGAGPTWLGDFYIFLAALAFAFFTVFGKPLTVRHSSITVNTFAYVGGGLALLPAILWESRGFPYARISAAGWSALFYMAMFPSLLAYLIYYYALRRIPASRVSAFSYLQPLVATVLGVVLLHETVTLPLVAGGAVIFTGVWVTERA